MSNSHALDGVPPFVYTFHSHSYLSFFFPHCFVPFLSHFCPIFVFCTQTMYAAHVNTKKAQKENNIHILYIHNQLGETVVGLKRGR